MSLDKSLENFPTSNLQSDFIYLFWSINAQLHFSEGNVPLSWLLWARKFASDLLDAMETCDVYQWWNQVSRKEISVALGSFYSPRPCRELWGFSCRKSLNFRNFEMVHLVYTQSCAKHLLLIFCEVKKWEGEGDIHPTAPVLDSHFCTSLQHWLLV